METSVPPKTFADHLDYLHDLVRLKLWFVWHWQRTHPDEPFQQTLRSRVDIVNKLQWIEQMLAGRDYWSPNWDDRQWLALEERAHHVFLACREADSGNIFEQTAFPIFQPDIDAYAHTDFTRMLESGKAARSVRFDAPGGRHDPRDAEHPTSVVFHIVNTISPSSIFADPDYLPACLLEVMRGAEEAHGATELCTTTWLNSYPRWQALFPPDWMEHMTPNNEDVLGNLSFWGQFVNARQTFSVRRGEYLRETGRLPYYPRRSWCSFASLRAHLRGHNS